MSLCQHKSKVRLPRARGVESLANMIEISETEQLELLENLEKNSALNNKSRKIHVPILKKTQDFKKRFCKLQYINFSGNQCSLFAFVELLNAIGKIKTLRGIDLGDIKILPKSTEVNGKSSHSESSGSSAKLRTSNLIDDIVFSNSKTRSKDTTIEEILDTDEEDGDFSHTYSSDLDEKDDLLVQNDQIHKTNKYERRHTEKFDEEDEDLYSDEAFYSSTIRDALLKAMAEWQRYRDENIDRELEEKEKMTLSTSNVASSLQVKNQATPLLKEKNSKQDVQNDPENLFRQSNCFTIGLIGFNGLREEDIERLKRAAEESEGYFKILC